MAVNVERVETPSRVAGAEHAARRRRHLALGIAAGTFGLVVIGALLVHHAEGHVNRIPLAAAPRPIGAVEAQLTTFSDHREYVGAVESWIEASVGPQYISAYVSTVLVRPGDQVRRGQVVATLDCAHPNAQNRAIEMRARSIQEQQRATADESARQKQLLGGGFISPNEVERTAAQSSSETARVLESQAQLRMSALEVGDCALKAPFDGEIASRSVDPGAFVRPGTTMLSIVDRKTVRVVVDAPEKDFEIVGPGVPVHVAMLATGAQVQAAVSRRAPKADPSTRTIHFEVDVSDPQQRYPTGTTAVVHVDVGKPVPAVRIPLEGATQQGEKAKLFVVQGNAAHLRTLKVLGERGGGLYFGPGVLPPRTWIVTDGRALLSDGDVVQARLQPQPPEPAGEDQGDAGQARGGGFGRPL